MGEDRDASGGKVVLIAANPFSGSKENRAAVESLIDELTARGLTPRPLWGRDELAAEVERDGWDRAVRSVVAAGGDGTLHGVVNSLGASDVPIAHFPLGTENLFASRFGHPNDPAMFAAMVETGRVHSVDLGLVRYSNARACFAIVASAGFDAEVIHLLDRWRAARPGKLRRVTRRSYVRPILAAALGYWFPTLRITADDRRIEGSMVMVFNLPRYGLGFNICPDAVADDGLLDYVVFTRPGRMALGVYGVAAQLNRLAGRRDVLRGRAESVRISAEVPVPLELDGEAAGFTEVDLTTEPRAMKVIVPSEPRP